MKKWIGIKQGHKWIHRSSVWLGRNGLSLTCVSCMQINFLLRIGIILYNQQRSCSQKEIHFNTKLRLTEHNFVFEHTHLNLIDKSSSFLIQTSTLMHAKLPEMWFISTSSLSPLMLISTCCTPRTDHSWRWRWLILGVWFKSLDIGGGHEPAWPGLAKSATQTVQPLKM